MTWHIFNTVTVTLCNMARLESTAYLPHFWSTSREISKHCPVQWFHQLSPKWTQFCWPIGLSQYSFPDHSWIFCGQSSKSPFFVVLAPSGNVCFWGTVSNSLFGRKKYITYILLLIGELSVIQEKAMNTQGYWSCSKSASHEVSMILWWWWTRSYI